MKVLIFGRANGVWDEIKQALSMGDFDRVIGVGSAGCDYPGAMSDWCTFHGNMFPRWIELRKARGYPGPLWLWSASNGRRICEMERRFGVQSVKHNDGGSSGKIAYDVARLRIKATKIVLCGIPLTVEGGQYDTDRPWHEALRFRVPWEKIVDDTLRSMSGWTMQKFGSPTKEWLDASGV